MTKQESIFADLELAVEQLKKATSKEYDEFVRDATVQRFEFTFELAWKLMAAIIGEQGIQIKIAGVKTTIREAAKLGLIDEPEVWFEYLRIRNLSVHTYNEKVAEEMYQSAKKFVDDVKNLLTKAKQYV